MTRSTENMVREQFSIANIGVQEDTTQQQYEKSHTALIGTTYNIMKIL